MAGRKLNAVEVSLRFLQGQGAVNRHSFRGEEKIHVSGAGVELPCPPLRTIRSDAAQPPCELI